MDDLLRFGYLGALVVSILGIGALDFRHKLALPKFPIATVSSILVGVMVFLAWDLVGIWLGIFFRGETSFLSGILLAPELPLEELFFLILLCYTSLVMYLGIARRSAR